MSEDLEIFAEKAHDIWARWMDHFLKKYPTSASADDLHEVYISVPKKDIRRWKRQITQKYKYLTEKEKESDRKIAREVFDIE